MKRLKYQLGVLLVIVLVFWLGAKVLLPMIVRAIGNDPSLLALLFALCFGGSLVLAILLFELAVGRAFGHGLTGVAKEDDPGEYWSRIRYRLLTLAVVVGTVVFSYFRRK
jgi:hypothetical protein